MKKAALVFMALLLVMGVLACGSSGEKTESAQDMVFSGAPAPRPAPAPAPTSPTAKYASGQALPEMDGERMIVSTGEISLVVDDVLVARDNIATLATDMGGYVVSSWISGEEEDEMRGNIAIRVPADEFDAVIAGLRGLAERVTSENKNSTDVTEEYIDLSARLTNAKATEAQYRALLDRAVNVEEILSIYDSLGRVRSEIDQLEGRITYLERTAAMSLISVRLEPSGSPQGIVKVGWSLVEVAKSALRGIVIFGQGLANVLVWALVFSPVWGGVTVLVWWLLRRRRKGTSAG